MKEFFKSRTVSFYLRVVLIILTIVPIVYMITRIPVRKNFIAPVICAALAAVAEVCMIIFENKKWSDYLEEAGSALVSAELCLFIAASVLDMVDYFWKINFWGDSTQFPAIVAYGVLLLAGTVISIVCCFMNKAYEKAE